MANVSLIIPCFNEEENVGALLETLSSNAVLKESEIIVIDDGSSDRSVEIIERLSATLVNFKLIKHPRNQGYGYALVSGMKAAKSENIIWMDSDGQHRLRDVERVLEQLSKEDIDYVVGERDKASHQVRTRVFGKFILRNFIKLTGVGKIQDFNSGLRGFKRRIIIKYLHLLIGGFGASTVTTLLLEMRGYHGVSVSITVDGRLGTSSVKQVRDGLRTITLILRAALLFRPLRFFTTMGVCLFLSGLMYGFYVALLEQTGFPVFGSLLVLAGLQTIFLGLVSDQISQMRIERLE